MSAKADVAGTGEKCTQNRMSSTDVQVGVFPRTNRVPGSFIRPRMTHVSPRLLPLRTCDITEGGNHGRQGWPDVQCIPRRCFSCAPDVYISPVGFPGLSCANATAIAPRIVRSLTCLVSHLCLIYILVTF